MDERLRETLSAMMDDEADELSVRRLLSRGDQEDVRGQWQRWQQIRDLMHENHGPMAGEDMASRVQATLNGQPAQPETAPLRPASRSWHWPVAAMVALALVVGFGAGTGWQNEAPVPGGDQLASAPADNEAGQVAVTQASPVLPASIQEVTLQGLDEEQRRQMRQYMLEHAQHNSVGAGRGSMGYARMVSVNGGY